MPANAVSGWPASKAAITKHRAVIVEVDFATRDRRRRSDEATYRISVKPSARSRSSAMYPGATQMLGSWSSRIVVVSGGPSSASDARVPNTPAAPADDRLARKSRRFWMICIGSLLSAIVEAAGRLIRPAAHAHAFSSRLSSLRKRQSVPSARSCVRARLDHADLVEAQRVEAHRVLGIELAPAVVGQLRQRLERVFVARREPAIDQTLRGPLRLGGADVGGLEDGTQKALGGDRMIADELRCCRTACSRSTATMAGPSRC